MAPQAKIAFQDLGSGAAGSIGPPDDLANDYYQYSYDKCVLLPGQTTDFLLPPHQQLSLRIVSRFVVYNGCFFKSIDLLTGRRLICSIA